MDKDGKDLALAQQLQEHLRTKLGQGTAASAAFIRDGELIAACAVGTQDGDAAHPATVGDLYNIGSVSKVYCAMAVMKLVEQGKVALDEPVATYLPRFHMRDERYRQITVRMCLNHASGLPGTSMKNAFCSRWMGEGFYDDFYDYLAKSKLKAAPGAFSVYCNDGFTLAELVVAEVSGMSYSDFIRTYISDPLGAASTGTSGWLAPGHTLVSEAGKKAEYLAVLGAGGIATDLSDCARFGYLFIDPQQKLFKPESLQASASPQGVSFLTDNFALGFGLGWDKVNSKVEEFDFGEDVLVKSGGTLSFSTYLIVIPEYHLAAALSSTFDTKMDSLQELCELTGQLLEAQGCPVRRPAPEPAPEESCTVPEGWAERFDGVYYNGTAIYRIQITTDGLKMQTYGDDDWQEKVTEARFDGAAFVAGKSKFVFQEHQKNAYLVQQSAFGMMPIAQKPEGFPKISEVWQKRLGKRYLVCDGEEGDLILGEFKGVTICAPIENGPICFASNLEYQNRYTPVLPLGDNDTEYFLDGPGSAASRDTYTPFFWVEDGKEYGYFCGFTCVEESK